MGFSRGGLARSVKWIILPVVAAAILAQGAPPVSANPQAELDQARQRQQQLQRERQQAENALQRLQLEVQEAQAALQAADSELAIASSRYQVLTSQLAAAEQELKRLEAELKEAIRVYNERKDFLANRVRTIHEEGRVNYLAVLLGSNSFSDFISRFEMLRLVVKRDAQLFDQIRADRAQLERSQAEAEQKRNGLALLRVEAQQNLASVEEKRAERQVASRSLESRRQDLRNQLAMYDREEQRIQQEIYEIQRRMARAGGTFAPVFPLKSVNITDNYGPRIHPILGTHRMHNGTDFAARTGDPVYAIEDGTVIMAEWNDAYGWLVVIDHGGGIASWYGHSSRLLVKAGQNVKQGQQIAAAGSTGWSTGPHVHLEIHINGKPVNPMDYLR